MTTSTSRRYGRRRQPGEPRTCRFLVNGKEHGIILDDDNSYPTSTYCKPHHAQAAARSRQRTAEPPKRHRRKAGEARHCAFVMPDGQAHGIALTAENSYKTSAYCREHHKIMKQRSLQTDRGRAGNIKRVTEYKQRHRDQINEKRRHLAAAKSLASSAGISVEQAKAQIAMLQLPPPPAAVLIDRCFKVPNARRYHVAGAGLIALCNNWRAAPGAEMVSLPADHPELCRACANRWLEKAAKAAKS